MLRDVGFVALLSCACSSSVVSPASDAGDAATGADSAADANTVDAVSDAGALDATADGCPIIAYDNGSGCPSGTMDCTNGIVSVCFIPSTCKQCCVAFMGGSGVCQ